MCWFQTIACYIVLNELSSREKTRRALNAIAERENTGKRQYTVLFSLHDNRGQVKPGSIRSPVVAGTREDRWMNIWSSTEYFHVGKTILTIQEWWLSTIVCSLKPSARIISRMSHKTDWESWC